MSAQTGNEVLVARGISRRFGGLVAVSQVSISLSQGEVHALIGTNGAGKSTLVNILSGELPATEGTVKLGRQDISQWSQPQRARAGIGRSYQRTTIFPSFTVLENCRLAAQSRTQRAWDWLTPASRCAASVGAAHRAVESSGLAAHADRIAGTLAHGQKRQLEIAMCLATSPTVLLLDEPLAGMGAEETERMLAVLEALKPGHAILLVEHDMDAVFRVSERITVMVNGTVIASGAPDEVRADPEVQLAYLGDTEQA